MIKTNIKMRVTPEQSRRVQEICFKNGVYWNNSGDKYVKLNEKFRGIYIEDNILVESIGEIYFNTSKLEEIDADFFIKTNGTCELTYLTKYTSQPKDLESALKKIENLHIALNKKVEKIKNQALEINKLLEQKKDLKEINNSQNIYIKNLENDLDNLKKSDCVNSNILNDYIRELETKVNKLEAKSKIDTKWIAHQKTIKENLNRIVSEIGTKQRIEAIEHKKQLKEKDTIISYLEGRLK